MQRSEIQPIALSGNGEYLLTGRPDRHKVDLEQYINGMTGYSPYVHAYTFKRCMKVSEGIDFGMGVAIDYTGSIVAIGYRILHQGSYRVRVDIYRRKDMDDQAWELLEVRDVILETVELNVQSFSLAMDGHGKRLVVRMVGDDYLGNEYPSVMQVELTVDPERSIISQE